MARPPFTFNTNFVGKFRLFKISSDNSYPVSNARFVKFVCHCIAPVDEKVSDARAFTSQFSYTSLLIIVNYHGKFEGLKTHRLKCLRKSRKKTNPIMGGMKQSVGRRAVGENRKSIYYNIEDYYVGGFRMPRHTNITPTANMDKLTMYTSERLQYELIKRKRHPELKNKIAPTM